MLRSLRMRPVGQWRALRPYCTGGGAAPPAGPAGDVRRLRYGRAFGGHLLRDDKSVLLVRHAAGDEGGRRRAEQVAAQLSLTAVAVHAPPREQRGRRGAAKGGPTRDLAEEEEEGEGERGGHGGERGARDDKLRLRLSREEVEELEESLPRAFLDRVEREGHECRSGVFSLDVTEDELSLRFVRAKGPGLFLRSSKWMVDFGRQHRRDHGYDAARRRRGSTARAPRPTPLLRALGAKGLARADGTGAPAASWALGTPSALPWHTVESQGGGGGGGGLARGLGDGSLFVRGSGSDGEAVEPLRVMDVCAGLGNDAFLLAKAGAEVLMVERHPVVHLLLRDGVERARALAEAAMSGQGGTHATEHIDEEFVAAVGRLGVVSQPTDALPLLEALGRGEDCGLLRPHMVFVDPMHNTKSAKGRGTRQAQLPTFKMQMARDIVGSSSREEQSKLLEGALAAASRRVIYKRPQYAEALPSHLPTALAEYKGKAVYYTVFAGTM